VVLAYFIRFSPQSPPAFGPKPVAAGRVAPFLGQIRQHRLPDLQGNRRRGVVIQINHSGECGGKAASGKVGKRDRPLGCHRPQTPLHSRYPLRCLSGLLFKTRLPPCLRVSVVNSRLLSFISRLNTSVPICVIRLKPSAHLPALPPK